MPHLGIVTALMAEAVPLIDFYRLKKQPKEPGYHHFTADKIDLIVAGMSRKNMTHGLKAYFNAGPTPLPNKWLNLGIAGSKSKPIGTLVWASSIEGVTIGLPESAENQRGMNVISLSKPSVDYKPDILFDMEAGAYLKSVRENVAEVENAAVFCAKVISDNAQESNLEMDKNLVSSLIQQNLSALDITILNLIKSYG